MRGLVIAGTHSGCGKTTVTLGVMAALRKKGLAVQPFKAGPDFIDSGLHRLATGRISRNLDLWMCGEGYVRASLHRNASTSALAVVEGVMGLYDGNMSTAHLARTLGLPVVLVVDGYGMAESAGPMVRGFLEWPASVGPEGPLVKAVIFNRVASEYHYERLRRAVTDVPVLGYLPRDAHFEIPHRHLGLIVAEEDPVSAGNLDRLAETILVRVDLEKLVALTEMPMVGPANPTGPMKPVTAKKAKKAGIAVAADKAFCFYYQDNLDLLEEAGGQIHFFSPLTDLALPEGIDALYLGGGYPELHAASLSRNNSMRRSIREWAASGGVVYAECGGLMYLARSIRDFEGNVHEMVGVFPFETTMTQGRAHLGYREVEINDSCAMGRGGDMARGHEFHYSAIRDAEHVQVDRIYGMKNVSGETLPPEGYRQTNVLGSYVHIHFGSSPSIARRFVKFAQQGRN